jgi:hypothetical protein
MLRTEPPPLRADAGTLLGLLFASRFVDDDPFLLASKLLASTGANDAVFVSAVGRLVEECWPLRHGHAFHKTAYDCQVALSSLSRTHLNPGVRQTAVEIVVRLGSAAAAPAQPLLPAASAPAVTVGAAPAMPLRLKQRPREELTWRRRTIYVSRLEPATLQRDFGAFFTSFGPVNRVRVCKANGFPTLFGFVEMSSESAADAVIGSVHRVIAEGNVCKCRAAKSHVQDEIPTDAVHDAGGRCVRPCTFGVATGGATMAGAAEVHEASTAIRPAMHDISDPSITE